MSVSASLRFLVLGIGNTLRRDDGIGPAVARQLASAQNLDCDIQAIHQLTPELAQSMAQASLVIMLDANREGKPGEIHIRQCARPVIEKGALGAHHMVPEELAALTEALYGRCPPIMVITMTGADFGLGERLSPAVTRALPRMSTLVRQLCAYLQGATNHAISEVIRDTVQT